MGLIIVEVIRGQCASFMTQRFLRYLVDNKLFYFSSIDFYCCVKILVCYNNNPFHESAITIKTEQILTGTTEWKGGKLRRMYVAK